MYKFIIICVCIRAQTLRIIYNYYIDGTSRSHVSLRKAYSIVTATNAKAVEYKLRCELPQIPRCYIYRPAAELRDRPMFHRLRGTAGSLFVRH